MDKWLSDRVTQSSIQLVRWLERLLALAVIVAVGVYGIGSGQVLASMDWRTSAAFYEMIYRVLLLAIGLELVRMLVVHDLIAVLELLAFVVARKMLKPDLVALDILLAVVAFVALLVARHLIVAAPSLQERSRDETPEGLNDQRQ